MILGGHPCLQCLASDTPKLEGNSRESPSTHITTYCLWCSSNSLMDDSIKLRLFQQSLTKDVDEWYTELDTTSLSHFSSFVMTFLTHFQLPTR